MKIINHFFHISTSPAWSYGFAIAGVGLYCGGSAFASCSLTANLAHHHMLKSLMSKQFDSRDFFQFWMQSGKKFFQNCAEANPKISCAYSSRCLLQDPNKYMTPAEQQPARVLSNRLRQYLR